MLAIEVGLVNRSEYSEMYMHEQVCVLRCGAANRQNFFIMEPIYKVTGIRWEFQRLYTSSAHMQQHTLCHEHMVIPSAAEALSYDLCCHCML